MSSVLLVILLVMTLFDTEEEAGRTAADTRFDPRLILLFTTLFGWLAVLGYYLDLPLRENILYPLLLAFFPTFLPAVWRYVRRRPSRDLSSELQGVILETGQVLQPIPPHRNGLGKVQLDFRQRGLAIDAVTTGQEIEPGAPVRVVDIIDNRILVVEPLPEDIPPDGGMIRMSNE